MFRLRIKPSAAAAAVEVGGEFVALPSAGAAARAPRVAAEPCEGEEGQGTRTDAQQRNHSVSSISGTCTPGRNNSISANSTEADGMFSPFSIL